MANKADELRDDTERPPLVGILTVSDRCYLGTHEDSSGPNLKAIVEQEQGLAGLVVKTKIVPDERTQIQDALISWSDEEKLDLILTTGGTGFAERDVTPEATKAIIEKEAPGLALSMLMGSLRVTPLAMLSRPACGTRGKSLIINLPGSKKGSQECYEFVLPGLRHAIHLLRGDSKEVVATHKSMTSGVSNDHSASHGHKCHHGNDIPDMPEHHHDISKVARRPRTSPYPMITYDEAYSLVMSKAVVLAPHTINCKDALGYILANDVTAQHPLPPFRASIKDGYAVISSDGPGPRRVLSDSLAGQLPKSELISGYVIRITTGAPVPDGADAVVEVEATELLKEADGGEIELEVNILKAVKPGQDIRPVGLDIQQHQVILQRGARLGPAELGLLASVGVTHVPAYRMPKVAVVSTGNELCEPHQECKKGHIFDSNRTTLLSALAEHGFPCVDLGIAKDNAESLQATLKSAVSQADVVISTGGVSMGERDLLKYCLMVGIHAKVHFGRVFLKPGKPTSFATITSESSQKLFFALPGNPASAIVTFNLFVLPALRKMMGYTNPNLTKIKAKVASDIKLDPRPEFQRVKLAWEGDELIPTATITGSQMSSRLLSMADANALLMLPSQTDGVKEMKKGSIVDALIIGRV
ncbi:gephyrin-like isoform X2 [Acanthaster planci]|uniref:Gephyrin n=1 Tax=Acanthaster planci TaxID=133434 RepID=A0A8B7YDF1_ACAPL|nr:gephyrin-like isoform X2 [Acanthaster planci]